MRKTIWLFLLWHLSVRCLAQNEANIWYFGVNAGLDFNVTPPTALTNGALSTSEGCATLCDKNGNLLFYSDGINVWTRTHVQMPNGFGLMGHPSAAQSAIIVPRPGSSTLFYVFTVDREGEPNGVRYSEVDMTLNGGLGDVTAVKNILLHARSTEKITAVGHGNGVYYWVISHGLSNNRYYAHLVDCNGVQAPVISDVGSVEGPPGWGYHVASPDGRKLATAMRTAGFELLDFDNVTGVLSNPVNLGFGGECYGVSFSPSNDILYGLKIGNGELRQWDLQAGSPAAIIASVQLLGSVPGSGFYDGGALQLGPDGKLYIIQCRDPFLTVVHQPDVLGAGCNLQFNAVDLAGREGVLGLPPFIQSFFDTSVLIQTNGHCERQPVSFSMNNVSSFLDSVLWNFGDPASGVQDTSTLFSPAHTYTTAGTYTVQLIRYVNCIRDTVELDVVIDPPLSFTQDITICTSVTFTLPGGRVVSSTGTYRDTLTAAGGCDSIVVTNLSVLGASITASNDTGICLGASVQLAVQGGIFTRSWSPGTGLSDSTIINPVATPLQTTTYIVTSQVASDELIVNGDFSAGAGSFSSAYNYTTNLHPEGTYYVGSNPNSYHSGFNACPDHTGAGNMMIINGSGNPGTHVWCQTVNVLPNTNYAFSCWVQSVVSGSPALLQFSINGNLLGSLFSAPGSSCVWQQFYVIWNSGANPVANICIVNQNTALGGNDFALDDISFMGLCNAMDTVTITVHQPTTTILDTAICEGLTYIFPDGTSSAIAASNTSLLTSRFGCSDSTVITNLTINPSPVVNVNDSICPGGSFTRPSGLVVSDAGDYTDTLSTNTGCDSIVVTHLSIRRIWATAYSDTVCIGFPYTLPDGSITQTEGVHSVILQAANGCDSTVTITLDHFDVSMQVSPPVTIDVGETVDLDVSSPYDPAVSYSWTPSTALTCDNCTTAAANPLEDIVYNLQASMAIAGNVCYDTGAIPVTVIPDHGVFIPNAFTPNGDGSNDFFQIFGNLFALQTLEVQIFDRTGEKVFESDNIHFGWDGTYKDKKLNPAVFVYVIKVSYIDYFPDKFFKGSVTLMR